MIDQELRFMLGLIWSRPLMFFSYEATLLSSLHGFINGFCYAKDEDTAFVSIVNGKDGAFPGKQFTKHLQAKHGFPQGMNADWFRLICNKHGSDGHGFDSFFSYLNDFMESVEQEPIKQFKAS